MSKDLCDNDENENVCEDVTHDIKVWIDKQENGFCTLHVNIRSIRKNWDGLQVIIRDIIGKFDVLILTETSFVYQPENFHIDGYTQKIKTRNGRRGGGIAIFIRNDWCFTENSDRQFESFEYVYGTVSKGNFSYAIIAIYRPPSLSKILFIADLEQLLGNVKERNCLLAGDINIDLLSEDEYHVFDYVSLLASSGFIQCIRGPTREEFKSDQLSSSCIDHIFVRGKDATNINSMIYLTKLTDHYMIGTSINERNTARDMSPGDCPEPTIVKNKLHINDHAVSVMIHDCKWSPILENNDVNILYNCILDKFDHIYLQSSFNKESNSSKKPRKSWMTMELLNMVKRRDSMFVKWKNCASLLKSHFRVEYNKLRNQVAKQIKLTKRKYFKDLIEAMKTDLKETWKIINEIRGKPRKAPADEVIIKHLGKDYSLDCITTNFANTFVSEIDKLFHTCSTKHLSSITNIQNDSQPQSMHVQKVTKEEIKDIILHMDVKKQPGIDKIRTIDLVKSIDVLSPIIAHMVNLSLHSGCVPIKMKCSIIKPIFKKGDHKSFQNYRPISILPVMEKILERCVAKQLQKYLKDFNVINSAQFGFQSGKSTNDLFVLFSEYINSKLNVNDHILAVFIDFSKAFDTLNHIKLTEALKTAGIRGPLLRWFTDYLENRKFVVRIGNTFSLPQNCNTGVAQGSILGPVLYLLYVNNMFKCMSKCKMFMYADDTVVLSSHHDLHTAEHDMQRDFNEVLRWTHDNDLVINSEKTKLMHICSPYNRDLESPVSISCHSYDCLHILNSENKNCLGCVTIDLVSTHIYLGLKIDRLFSWRPHIDALCSRLRICTYQLYNLKLILPFNTIRNVYCAIAESLMTYGLLVWGLCSQGHLNKLKTIQNRIIKNLIPLHKAPYDMTITERYNFCNLLPIQKLFLFRFILKYYFCEKYKDTNTHLKNTRLQQNPPYKIPTTINKYGQRQHIIQIPLIFNSIPRELRHFKKYIEIKRNIKTWLLRD